MFVNCSMQSIKLHIAPVNTLLCFASGHKCSNQSLLQGFRGQNCGGTIQRRCGTHHPGHPRGAALHLHLRGSCQTQGTEQENNVYQGHPAAQPGLLLAQVWGELEREGRRRGVGRAAVVFCLLLRVLLVANSPLSQDGSVIAIGGAMAGIWKGKALLLTQCHWFKMQ